VRLFKNTWTRAQLVANWLISGSVLPASLVILLIFLGIHWVLVFDLGGYVTWGNYLVPYTQSQYASYDSFPSGWNAYQFMGSPTTFAFTGVTNFLTSFGPLELLSTVSGPAIAAKLYAVLSTWFLGVSFLLLSRTLIKSPRSQLAATVLFVAGPFQFQLFGQGDYLLFTSQAFAFLSIYLLWLALSNRSLRWVMFPLSMISLLLTCASLQVLELGCVLYLMFAAGFFILNKRDPQNSGRASIGWTSVRLLALPVVLSPMLASLVYAPINVGPSSPLALPLTTFSSYTTNPLGIFLLCGYRAGPDPSQLADSLGYQMISAASNTAIASVWLGFVVSLVVLTWAGLLIYRDLRGYLLLGVVTIASLIGSGPHGPLGFVNTYLYLHMVGFQALNASYYWDWIVVAPLFALAFGILVERLTSREAPGSATGASASGISNGGTKNHSEVGQKPRPRRLRGEIVLLASVVAIFSISAVALPYTVNAQYGPDAIHTVSYPADYEQIPAILKNLIGPEYAGVALFNPDAAWFLFNSTHNVLNAFFAYPTVRTPGLPVYLAPPYASNFYYYWVYQQFYTNSTRYVGELLAITGVEYFIVFYGVQSASYHPYFLQFSYGKNASVLMKYQENVVPVLYAHDYAIYRDLYYSHVAASVSNLSIVAGGYSELDAMAYAGFNLTNQALLFPSDFPGIGCPQVLSRTSRVYAESANALVAVALECVALESTNPLSYLPEGASGSNSWYSSYQQAGISIVDSWPTALAMAYGGPYSLSIPIAGGGCSADCRLWLPVRFSGDGGGLVFGYAGAQWFVNTSRGWDGQNNSMVWLELPFNPAGVSGTLQITAESGRNAVGTVFLAQDSEVVGWISNFSQTDQIIITTPGDAFETPSADISGQQAVYASLPTNEALENQSLYLQATGNVPIELPIDVPGSSGGWLSLLVRALATTNFVINAPPARVFGFNTGSYNGSNLTVSWIRVPIGEAELGVNRTLMLQVTNGSTWISEVTFAPFSAYSSPVPSSPSPSFYVAASYQTPSVKAFNVAVTKVGSNGSLIRGYIGFENSTSFYDGLGDVTFRTNTTFPASAIAVQYSISPGVLLSMDGMNMAGNGTSGLSQFGAPLLSQASPPPYDELRLSFSSYGSPIHSRVNASFQIWLYFASLATNSTLTDVVSGSNWTVVGGAQGYSLSGSPSSLVLVRVPYYSSLRASGPGTALSPGLGSVDSLLWVSSNLTEISVTPSVQPGVAGAVTILLLFIPSWMLAEYLSVRLTGGTRLRDPPMK